MRNLKRALSLAMASVMLLGMMVVGTSAKGLDDFGDAEKVVNQDAVAVTAEIGIFDGYEDGEFKPENVVTRAEMAVIVCKMLYGADVNVDQFKETKVFTDVPDWAEGYVNLCNSLGIVVGYGDGKFGPNDTVTTAQAAMMLTKTLGYFQSEKDFGDDWSLAATAKATQLGLYGDMKLSANAGLTRDNVAEMVFNALTKAVPVQYNELLGVYYNENQGIIYSLEFNYLQTLGYKNFDLVYKSNTSSTYGRPATTWGIGSYNAGKTTTSSGNKDGVLTEEGGLIASLVRMLDKDEIITVANEPDYVYTDSTKNKDVYTDLGKTICDTKEYDWTAFVNGAEQDEAIVPVAKDTTRYTYTDKGAVTEIYVDDADQTVTVVEYNYYLGQVSKVKADSDGEYITVKPLSKGASLSDRTFYVAGYEEDDYVVFTIDQDENDKNIIAEVFTPETVTGEVTRVENDTTTGNTYLRIDGTKYPYSGATKGNEHIVYDLNNLNVVAHPTLKTDYVLYMDPNGFVLGFEKADETNYQYLYVLDSDEQLGDWRAKVLLADGTTKTVDVSYSGGIKWLDPDAQHPSNDSNLDNLIWAYTVSSSGTYKLRAVPQYSANAPKAESQDTATNAVIRNGKAYITDGEDNIIVDKQTVFADKADKVAYTGYTEVPTMEKAKLAYVLEDNVAQVVFVLSATKYDENSVYFYLTSSKRESLKYDGNNYWEYLDAYVDGEKQSVIVAYNYDGVAGNDAVLEAGKLYHAVRTIDEEYIVELAVVPTNAAGTVFGQPYAIGDDAFWVTDTKAAKYKFDCDEDTTFVFVEKQLDKAGKVTKYTVSEGNLDDMRDPKDENVTIYVHVIEEDDEYAQLVYIYAEVAPEGEEAPVVKDGIKVTIKGQEITVEVTGEATVVDIAKAIEAELEDADYTDIELVVTNAGEIEGVNAKDGALKIYFNVTIK